MSEIPSYSGAASGGKLEERIDLSAETDVKIAQSKTLATAQQLAEALTLLFALEKRCRVGNDTASLSRVCQAALEICHEHSANETDYEALLSTLNAFATRRSQKTSAIQILVRTAMPWCVTEPYHPRTVIAELEDGDVSSSMTIESQKKKHARDQLVIGLRDITDGKIFLERELAILTRVLAAIKEEEGHTAEAADILQQVHVETYGSLSKKEKIEFILEQMRLTLAKKDFVRSAIVAGKVSRKHLLEDKMEQYKVRFFQLMTIQHRHERDSLELAKDYHAIYSTSHIQQDEAAWKEALAATVLFLALSPYGNEQQDMLHRIRRDHHVHLEQLPPCESTVNLLLKKEIINYPMQHQVEMENMPFCQDDGLGPHWHEIFHQRIIQHNIRVVSLYYKQIRGHRLAQLLQLDPGRLEAEIASMVSDGTVYAKIDRPKDIVRFTPPQNPEAILSDWAADIEKLLHLLETTTHLIHKENMTLQ